MEYMTPQEAAEKWGINQRSVQLYCSNNKIPGAKRVGRQWLIPVEAKKPVDKRSSYTKADSFVYHFPILFFSPYYVDNSVLSEEEKELLEAQILHYQGKFIDSVDISRKLIKESNNTAVIMGAYWINSLNFTLLGLSSELINTTEAVNDIIQNEKEHQEDYKLIMSHIRFHFTISSIDLCDIDISNLSKEALTFYQYYNIFLMIYDHEIPSNNNICFLKALAKNLKNSGQIPLSIMVNGLLVNCCERFEDFKSRDYHINEVCNMSYERGLATMLSKYSNISTTAYHKCMCQYGTAFANEVERQRELKIKNMISINQNFGGNASILQNTSIEREIMLLLSHDMTNQQIAILKNIPKSEVNRMVKELCARNDFTLKKELVEYCKAFFNMSKRIQSEDMKTQSQFGLDVC